MAGTLASPRGQKRGRSGDVAVQLVTTNLPRGSLAGPKKSGAGGGCATSRETRW
jgi:hypothetical protein